MPSLTDLAWATGFLEGEGSFQGSATNGLITVSAVQVQLEPLVRLQKMLGGNIRQYINKNGRPYHKWTLNGSHAVGLAFTVYLWLSPRRREQALRMIATWKGRPGRNNSLKTQCPRGHPYDEQNTYRYGKTSKRHCRVCVFTVYPVTRVRASNGE